ncbi:MAG: hypothetical protein CL908_19005 [Deltaproteobacteria bacterium]|nr:hypothetical protein [Deltaproteobacteria bacterium]
MPSPSAIAPLTRRSTCPSADLSRKRLPKLAAIVRLLLISLCWSLCASAEEPPRVRIGWVDEPPTIDGVMDEALWLEGGLVDQLTQVIPDTGEPARQRTEIRIVTDGETLFIGFRCWDTNPEQIIANRKRRDTFPFFDDRVGVALDTFHTRRNGYYFGTNPNAMRHDVLVEGENFEISWDTIWFVDTSIDAEGWTAEMAIPFSSLSFDPQIDTWGINFERGVRRNNEDTRWTDAAPQRFLSSMGTAGVLEGMRGIEQGLGLELTPGATFRRIDDPNTDDRFEFDPTFDGFYKVLPSVTAAATANTDFGQIEVDDVQINDDRFALFFPEKRDFFLEDGLIFDFGDISQNGRPFFSRRIGINDEGPVRILGGGKTTGRLGPVKFGMLDTYVEDKRNTPARNLFAGRVAANVLGESTIGAIVTNGNPGRGRSQTTVGLDYLYRNSNFLGNGDSFRTSIWFAKSINGGDTGSGRNHGYGVKVEYPNDRINWLLGFEELQEDYDPKLGFVNRNDVRHWFGSFRHRVRPASGRFRTIDSEVFGQIFVDSGNELETVNIRFEPIEFTTHTDDGFDLSYRFRRERVRSLFPILDIPNSTYTFHEGIFKVFTSRNRRVRGQIELAHGTFFDGTRTRVDADIEWRPSHFVFFEVEYEFRDVNLPQRGPDGIDGREDRDTQLVRLRTTLNFTANISWSTFVQYDNVSDFAGVNSRLRWIVQDGREFFVVLNQAFDTSDDNDRIEALRTEVLVKAIWTFTF